MNKSKELIKIVNSILESYGCEEQKEVVSYLKEKGYRILNIRPLCGEVEFLLTSKGRSGAEMELNKIADMFSIPNDDIELDEYQPGVFRARIYTCPC